MKITFDCIFSGKWVSQACLSQMGFIRQRNSFAGPSLMPIPSLPNHLLIFEWGIWWEFLAYQLSPCLKPDLAKLIRWFIPTKQIAESQKREELSHIYGVNLLCMWEFPYIHLLSKVNIYIKKRTKKKKKVSCMSQRLFTYDIKN